MNIDLQREQFQEQGFIILNNAFSMEDLLAFRKTFQKILARVLTQASKNHPHLNAKMAEDVDASLLALRYANPTYVSIAQRLISRSPEFFRLSSEPRVFNTIRQLLNVTDDSPLYLLSNGVVFTNPNDRENKRSSNFELDWHQDTFFTIPRSRYVQFWGPLLHDSMEEIGTLILCPGSHKDGYGKQRIHPELSFNHRYSMEPSEVKKYNPVSANMKLGQLLIFDGQLIHASGDNTSKQVRTTILGLCHDASRDECVPVSTEYRYHGETPEQWFYEVYKDEKAKTIMYDQLALTGEPKGGV